MTEDQKPYQNHTHSNLGTQRVNLRNINVKLWREFKAQAILIGVDVHVHAQEAFKRHFDYLNKP